MFLNIYRFSSFVEQILIPSGIFLWDHLEIIFNTTPKAFSKSVSLDSKIDEYGKKSYKATPEHITFSFFENC